MESPDRNGQLVGLENLKGLVARAPRSFSQARPTSRDASIGGDFESNLVEILADMVHSALAWEAEQEEPASEEETSAANKVDKDTPPYTLATTN